MPILYLPMFLSFYKKMLTEPNNTTVYFRREMHTIHNAILEMQIKQKPLKDIECIVRNVDVDGYVRKLLFSENVLHQTSRHFFTCDNDNNNNNNNSNNSNLTFSEPRLILDPRRYDQHFKSSIVKIVESQDLIFDPFKDL
jgi:hypothetical protein